MTFTKFMFIGATVVGLSACSSFSSNQEVEKLQMATAVGSPFTQQLTSEYKAFSDFELDNEKDYADALHFSRKGLSAAEGVNVMPEPVNDWDLRAADIAELAPAYARLISAFDRGAREILPGKSAIAQARYDCWIEEQEEIANGTGSTVPCKDDFMRVMSEVEAALPAEAMPAPVMEEQFPAPVTMLDSNEPLNIAEAMYLVFFDFDKSSVNAEGISVLESVVAEFNNGQINGINVVGHTDTSGSAAYNAKLANRRASSIKGELIARGVPAGAVTISGVGENDLLVATQDGIREPANRRGVITFQ